MTSELNEQKLSDGKVFRKKSTDGRTCKNSATIGAREGDSIRGNRPAAVYRPKNCPWRSVFDGNADVEVQDLSALHLSSWSRDSLDSDPVFSARRGVQAGFLIRSGLRSVSRRAGVQYESYHLRESLDGIRFLKQGKIPRIHF